MKRAIVLLSGGLDSATTAALARERGFRVVALSFDYGQRHAVELRAARRIARLLEVEEHVVQAFDLRHCGGSVLTTSAEVPKNRPELGQAGDIPDTYVPARNTIFLALALAYAETRAAEDIFIGVNALDYSGYPDCRPEYLQAFQTLAGLATRLGVEGRPLRIQAPLIDLGKAQIIAEAVRLKVPLAETVSCYDPDDAGDACGTCDSCRLRRAGFAQAGVADPTPYRTALLSSGPNP